MDTYGYNGQYVGGKPMHVILDLISGLVSLILSLTVQTRSFAHTELYGCLPQSSFPENVYKESAVVGMV